MVSPGHLGHGAACSVFSGGAALNCARVRSELRLLGTRSLVGPPTLYLRQAARLARREASLATVAAPLDERVVFVLGSPRSGTTFLAEALGSLPGFVDLGEVLPLKGAVPALARLERAEAARRLRRILWLTRRLGGVGGLRAVEQTPETVFLGPALMLAFPHATVIHLIRDGRDVVSSLLERGWLSERRAGEDDTGGRYGSEVRFWVEPDRADEFAAASDARRAAWAWRRYVSAGRTLGGPVHELRYERLVQDPGSSAEELAALLGIDAGPVRTALAPARPESVDRFRRDLSPEQLADVEAEAGPLLRELGY